MQALLGYTDETRRLRYARAHLSEPELVSQRPNQTLIADKNYFGRDFKQALTQA